MSSSLRSSAHQLPLDSSTAVARAARLAASRLQPIKTAPSSSSNMSAPYPTASAPSTSTSSTKPAMILRPRPAPTSTPASVRGPMAAPPPAAAASKASGTAQVGSGITVRGGKKSSREASRVVEGWEDELERNGVAAVNPPTSSLHVKTTASSAVSPNSASNRSSAASSPSSSYTSPSTSEPVSPIAPIRQLSRPSSAGRPSFGHLQHGATATALTHATSSLSLSISSLYSHPSVMRLHDSLTALPLLPAASTWLGVDIVYVALVGVCAVLAVSLGLVGLYGILEFLLFLYPAYMSYHALEYEPPMDGDDVDEEDDDELVRSWLTYWSVYALFIVISTVTDWVLWSGTWYRAGRLLLLLALSYPSSPLPAFLFHWLIRPLFVANLLSLDSAVEYVVQGAGQVVDECTVAVKEGVVWWLRGGAAPTGAAGGSSVGESGVLRGRRGARRGVM